jgi:hypothetical protein
MPNVLYKTFIAVKLLIEDVDEFWWETRLWPLLIVGHCRRINGKILER